ncbi:MAG TPA: ribonuclease H-like domain-containing protein [Candidatus Dormibacteraeota bacterium]
MPAPPLTVAALRDRLAGLGATRPASPPRPERRLPAGFEARETPYGVAWQRVEMLALGRVPGRTPPQAHAYLDTETTGLAGGTGTYAFAAAVARPSSQGVEVIQLFLAEPAGEAAFLHALVEAAAGAERIGTYNGSSFDLPLLRTRWVMSRMPGEFEYPPHVDLLHVARALLRHRLDSCSLRSVELALLGFERKEEISGALLPDAYFTYLRRGWSPLLEAALEHNRQDVVSLHYLHARLLLRLHGDDPWMEAGDWLALGRYLLRRGRRADGWRALRNAVAMTQGHASAAAALLIVRRLTRLRRPATALALVEAGLTCAPAGPLRADLERRQERLRGRLERLAWNRSRDRDRRRRSPVRNQRQRLVVEQGLEGEQQRGVVGSSLRLELGDGEVG